ncbi:MAG: PEP-CTERM sorting domain-containing protein [Planctomycetales bacterium]|nr:PEP-CTERM sorting domain-containing protein [Planctomycetales bacterium]
MIRHFSRLAFFAGAIVATAMPALRTAAQVVAPSFYTTGITVQGEEPGTEFDDWSAAGVPIALTDAEDNPFDIDFATVQVANDSDFLYIHATTYLTSPVSLANVYLGFDVDQDNTTGFDVLQIGVIGSEFGYQTDFPFAQATNVFNLNLSITGGPVGNGGAVIFPFWDDNGAPVGVAYEWKIPLDVVIQYPPALGGPALAIPNPSFDFVVYSDQGLGDITEVISYTLATPPASDADFNDDGIVDGEDFIAWQRGFGTLSGATNELGDADGNGTVDAADLAAWQSSFGGTTAAPLASATPEPTTAALAMLALAGFAGWRKR